MAAARLVCHCLLIEGAEGLVLVDTGFGMDDTRRRRQLGRPFNALVRPRLEEAETATAQLERLGFAPGDVRHIVTTHLDLDHAGGLPDFPDAEVHLLRRELQAAVHPSWRERPRYVAAHWAHSPRWVEHEPGAEEWLGFERVRVLPGSDAEILLIPLIGHTHGHTGVAIKRPEGWLLHCGDAFFHHGEMQTPSRCPAGMALYAGLTAVNDAARRQNRERLRELAERQGGEVELICSHDPAYLDARQAASASEEPHAV